MNVKEAIYSILTADAGISAIVGTKVYPSVAPSSAVAPFVVYSVISNAPIQTMAGSVSTKYRIQFSCFAFDSKTNTSVVSALHALMNNKRFRGAGFEMVAYEENEIESDSYPQDGSEQAVFQSNVDYMVWFRQDA